MKTGRAYGFVYCEATKDEFEKELPSLRKEGKILSELEITLMDTNDLLQYDPRLAPSVSLAQESGFNWGIKADYSDKSNYETAFQLSHLLMQAHQSGLNRNGELDGAVIYQDQAGNYKD